MTEEIPASEIAMVNAQLLTALAEAGKPRSWSRDVIEHLFFMFGYWRVSFMDWRQQQRFRVLERRRMRAYARQQGYYCTALRTYFCTRRLIKRLSLRREAQAAVELKMRRTYSSEREIELTLARFGMKRCTDARFK